MTETIRTTRSELLEIFESAVAQCHGYPDSHKDFVTHMIEAERRQMERREKVLTYITGTTVAAAILWMGSFFWSLGSWSLHHLGYIPK